MQQDPIRIAVRDQGLQLQAGTGATSSEQIRDAILLVMETWNNAMPCHHVRILNPSRWQTLTEALRTLTPPEICDTIRWYAACRWNVKNRAWQGFDAFFEPHNIVAKYERMIEDSEKDKARTLSIRTDVEQLADQQERARLAQYEQVTQLSAFAALPPARQAEILAQAVTELKTFQRFSGARLWPSLTCFAVKMQVTVIMKRNESHGNPV